MTAVYIAGMVISGGSYWFLNRREHPTAEVLAMMVFFTMFAMLVASLTDPEGWLETRPPLGS